MAKEPYRKPELKVLGTVVELTQTTPEADKCSGSGDTHTAQVLSPNYSGDCP